MKRRAFALMLILALLVGFVLSGCSRADGGKTTPRSRGSNEELLECNWVLKVDQTIPRKYKDGMTVEHTLVFIAEKEGGTDVSGTYHGAFCLRSKLDISEFSNEGVEFSGGFDVYGFGNDVTFDVVKYDITKYANFGKKEDELGIPHLIDYETMATFTHEITGTGVLNPYIRGKHEGMVSGGIDVTSGGSAPVPIKIAIQSGKVHVNFPTLDIGQSFEGLLLGEPLGDRSKYGETMDRIEAMMEEAEEGEDSGSTGDLGDIGGLDGLGSIMGQMGTNLPMPDSFPADDIPVLPGANIINVYENDNKTNVRIMYGIGKEYDEVLGFYEQEFISKLEKEPQTIDVDDGIMYMCDKEGYRNITIMIMEDPSKTYKSMVMLEVTKK
ncbi:MAG: hypothetical protein ACOYIF_06435 [Acetivibrionales bacterium]|jgi:hypothetical protein